MSMTNASTGFERGPTADGRPDVTGPRASVHVVVNPVSGGAIDEDDLHAAFDEALDGSLVWQPTTEDDPGLGQARAAVAAGATTVVACGGDGTVRAVLEGVAGTDTVLGVVALGTGNLLASNLELSTGIDAIADALAGPTRRLDVATANGERFAVMAGVGFDAMMIRDANPTVKKRLGSVAYVISAIRHVPARLVGASVSVDGAQVWHGRTAMVLVGNCGTVSGGLEVFPNAEPDDGHLDVAVLSARTARDWISVLWRLVRHRAQRPELVARFTGTSVDVRTTRPMAYELDGEDRPPARELHVEIEPAALVVRTRGSTTLPVEPTEARS
jgi:diacylglycerol kinase family enzyme